MNKMSKRLAMVIGNSDYHYLQNLGNADNDAIAVHEKLENLGFDSRLKVNADKAEILKFLREVVKAWQYMADEIVVYYSGHGLRIDEKVYLVPVDADTDLPKSIVKETLIGLDTIIELLASNRNNVTFPIIIILDCCRSNFEANTNPNLSKPTRESLSTSTVKNIAILYSTGNGQTALDKPDEDRYPDSQHSPFTELLLNNIDKEYTIFQLDRVIRNDLEGARHFTEGQTTWMYQCLYHDYRFNLSTPSLEHEENTGTNADSKPISSTERASEEPKISLHRAAEIGDVKIVRRWLAEFKMSPDTKNDNGDTPLHRAAEKANIEVVKLLAVDFEANLNATNNNGQTPLHRAADTWVTHPDRGLEVIRMLTDLGAQGNIKDNEGHNHSDLFKRTNSGRIAALAGGLLEMFSRR